jgi:hypothetical protein
MEAPLLQTVDILQADPSFGSTDTVPGSRINPRRAEKHGASVQEFVSAGDA